MENELDKLLLKSNGIIEGYEFYCSKDYECDLKEYKGIKIRYWNIMPKNTIYYALSMYFNECNLN